MSKRFTDSDKWSVQWFRRLPVEMKLGWLYLTDQCDSAGVIRLDRELADFQIGVEIDWDDFIKRCGDRLLQLPCGKLWVVEFIDFQYSKLSEACKAHNPVFASIKKHNLKGYSKGIQRVQDKDKDKEKVSSFNGEWEIPEYLDTPEVRESLKDFESMRRKIGKPIKDLKNSSRILKSFADTGQLLRSLDVCIGNEYQGLKPEYGVEQSKGRQSVKTFEQIKIDNTRSVVESFKEQESKQLRLTND